MIDFNYRTKLDEIKKTMIQWNSKFIPFWKINCNKNIIDTKGKSLDTCTSEPQ